MDDAIVTTKSPGAKATPENQARVDYILKRTNEAPGITSPTIAKELGISTLMTGQLADRLVAKGEIQLVKVGAGRTYYPKDFDVASIVITPPEPAPKKSRKKAAPEAVAADA